MLTLRRGFANFAKQVSSVHANDKLVDNLSNVVNKNPRNLELLRIARKPRGYNLDVHKQEFWHKLHIRKHLRHVVAEVEHFENGIVLSASTKEGALRKALYSLNDTCAYMNLGTIIARRCLESGIFEVRCDLEPETGEKVKYFLEAAQEVGLKLEESAVYNNPLPQTRERDEKPWEVFD